MEENRALVKPKKSLPDPNPVTQTAHRREFLRQVTLPFILFLILSIALALVLAYNNIGSVERWAEIATIFLIMFWMLLGLIGLALLVMLVFLVTQVLRLMPPYTRMAQEGIESIKTSVTKGADLTAKPFIQIQGFLAMVGAILGRKK